MIVKELLLISRECVCDVVYRGTKTVVSQVCHTLCQRTKILNQKAVGKNGPRVRMMPLFLCKWNDACQLVQAVDWSSCREDTPLYTSSTNHTPTT